MAISAFVQRFLLVHSNDRHPEAVEWDEGDVHQPAVVLVESPPVVLVASPLVVVATLLPGVSQGVSMIRSKRMFLSYNLTLVIPIEYPGAQSSVCGMFPDLGKQSQFR